MTTERKTKFNKLTIHIMNDTTYEILLDAQRECWKTIEEAHKKLNKVFGEKFNECCTITEIDERMQGWFGNLNKENCLSDYADQYRKNDGYWQECRCTKRLDFGEHNGMLYDWFCDSLMMDRDFIAGTGGTASDDPRLDAYETIYQVPREILDDCKFYANNCIVVRVDGVDTFIIDAQGYSYARYVALTEHTTAMMDE